MSKLKYAFQAFIIMIALFCISAINVQAQESSNEILIVSDQSLFITPNTITTFTAAFVNGTDGSKIKCIIADSNVATTTPIAYSENVAAFMVNFVSAGNTILAVFKEDDPSVVQYIQILSNPIEFKYSEKLGTNPFNYCTVLNYRYSYLTTTPEQSLKYKYSMVVNFRCSSFEDITNPEWNCYGTFYDAYGNAISKINLHCSTLAKDKCFAGEIKVPINATRLELESF